MQRDQHKLEMHAGGLAAHQRLGSAAEGKQTHRITVATQPWAVVDFSSSLGAMVRVQIEETVRVPPDQFLDLVMDIERYAEVDKKISPVLWARRDGDVVEFACRPKLAGLRQPKVVQYVRLTSGNRIDIGLAAPPSNRLAHAMAEFRASFECDAVEEGTRVVRTLEFTFSPLARWLVEPILRRRLEPEVREELKLAKDYLEQQHN